MIRVVACLVVMPRYQRLLQPFRHQPVIDARKLDQCMDTWSMDGHLINALKLDQWMDSLKAACTVMHRLSLKAACTVMHSLSLKAACTMMHRLSKSCMHCDAQSLSLKLHALWMRDAVIHPRWAIIFSASACSFYFNERRCYPHWSVHATLTVKRDILSLFMLYIL